MSHFRRFVIAALAIGLGSAFGVAAAAATPNACPRAAVARGALPQYELRVVVQPAERKLVVNATVSLPPAAAARERVRFRLRRDMGTPRVAVTAPAALAGPATVAALPSEKAGGDVEWELRLRRPLPPGQLLKLQIGYVGGGETSLNFNVSAEGVFVGGGTTAWYPQFGARGLGKLEVTIPKAFSIVATATRRSDAVQGGLRTVVFETAWPTHFGFTAGPYIVRRVEGRRPVTLYLLKDRPFADDLVEVARRSLEVLEREFGPYPFGDFSILEVAQEPASKSGFLGAAYDGHFLVRSDFLDAKKAEPAHFGHEIGHQWWGVSVEQAGVEGEYMLDEALANYGALRVTEELRGAAEAERFRRGGEGLGGGLEAQRLIAAGLDHRLAEVTLDPAYSIIHATPATMANAKAYEHSTRGQLLWDNGKTEEAKKELVAGLAAHAGADPTSAEFSERLYLGWIAQLAGQADETLTQYQRAAALPVRAPILTARLYLNLAQVLSGRSDKLVAAEAARAAIAAERAAGKATRITERAQTLLGELSTK